MASKTICFEFKDVLSVSMRKEQTLNGKHREGQIQGHTVHNINNCTGVRVGCCQRHVNWSHSNMGQYPGLLDHSYIQVDGNNSQYAILPSKICMCGVQESVYSHKDGQFIDNSFRSAQKMAALFDDQELSDIQIAVGHKLFHVHKLILCASSDVFRVMLTSPTWPESQKPRILLKEEPECMQVFGDFLRYLYQGKIHLNHCRVLPVLMLADKYNVSDLTDVCVDYMCKHMVSLVNYNHAASWLQYAELCGHALLAKTCRDFITWNFHKVMCTNDFLYMEKDLLLTFLRDSNLVILDEYLLYVGLIKWLQHQCMKYQEDHLLLRDSVLQVLSAVRFPMMTISELESLQNDVIASEYKHFYEEKVKLAIEYHALTIEERKHVACMSSCSDQYKPRNYTNDMWSTSLVIDSFSSLAEFDVRPLFFSSPISGSEADENKCWEWNVDLYPKGILFQKCIMIGLLRNKEISETVYRMVRLAVKAKTSEVRQVDIAVLVTGVQDGIEHIKRVVQHTCTFDDECCLYNLNGLVPYDELNCVNSNYLCGNSGDSFRITIIIKPLFAHSI